jgi:acyl carrier protein
MSSKYSDQQIIEMFKEAVFEVNNTKLGDVSAKTVISELNIDSVGTMEVIGILERKLEVRFPDEDLATLKSIGDLTALVRKLS